ncbi:hypothetical protein [Carboxydocella sp. ULO1]|uniref:hypothetical protein n=1 Tax=Carboxydocella sp. ULO1 TaxID=1926599 RepID=UPI0009C7B186|nr:hypothetical protein [Carboxydocella sp. ULO1]GAW28954.1 hypothetical protein ULO1_15240 [Carboxydocella sp. ULO1]
METIERTNILLEEILAEIRKITNYINLLEQRRVEAEKKVKHSDMIRAFMY